jgi:hypothetical protein
MEEYTQSAHSLDSYGVQFGKVVCHCIETESHLAKYSFIDWDKTW